MDPQNIAALICENVNIILEHSDNDVFNALQKYMRNNPGGYPYLENLSQNSAEWPNFMLKVKTAYNLIINSASGIRKQLGPDGRPLKFKLASDVENLDSAIADVLHSYEKETLQPKKNDPYVSKSVVQAKDRQAVNRSAQDRMYSNLDLPR